MRVRGFVGLLVAVCCVLVSPVGAGAAVTHGLVSSFGPGGPGSGEVFAGVQGVAVDQATGDVYVLDAVAGKLYKFDAEGHPAGFSGLFGEPSVIEGVGGAGGSENELAVDNSSGPARGDIYVSAGGSTGNTIGIYSSTGVALGTLSEAAGQPWGEPCGVAVDPSGNVYVGLSSGHVNRYEPKPAENPVTNGDYTSSLSGLVGETCNVAADSAGTAFADTWSEGPVMGYAASQFNTGEVTASGYRVDGAGSSLAVDPSSDDLYVDEQGRVAQFGGHGYVPLGSFASSGPGAISESVGIAVNGSIHDVYVSDGHGLVNVYGPGVETGPAVTIGAPTAITSTSATLHGTVNPRGSEPSSDATWHFEYSVDGGATWTATAGGDVGTGTSPVPVEEHLTGLPAGQELVVRLEASNAAGANTAGAEVFTTPESPPVLTTQQAQDIGSTHAALMGLVNPEHHATVYWFEYGPTTGYGTSVPATQDAQAGSGSQLLQAVEVLRGLTPGSAYHFRLVAQSAKGRINGEDETFTTSTPSAGGGCANEALREEQRAQYLQDCRAYEMVSPADKNGGDVMADSARARVAADGSAVGFASLAVFGDAIGTGVATDYMSTRGANGWETHAITPRQAPQTVAPTSAGLQSVYEGSFSEDLSMGVFLGWSPVTADANVANVPNIYLRSDLRAPGAGSYTLLSPCPLCASTSTPLPAPPIRIAGEGQPYLAGASADFGHVIFESQEPRTSDAPAGCDNELADLELCPQNLYESDHGTVRLVDVLPNSECAGTPPCVAHSSQAGQAASQSRLTPHTISADGSRVFFTVPDAPNSRSGALYMRVSHTTTVRLNASERAIPDPGGPQSATYWDASTDGSRVFFSTSEALTNDAPADGIVKLYMYDTTRPDSDPHNLTLISRDGGVQSVLGASSDGRYVYFISTGELVAGQPVSGVDRAVYVWHDGTIGYIAPVDASDTNMDTTAPDISFEAAVSRVTPDGLHLLFGSTFPGIGPTGYDQTCHVQGGGKCSQLYVYSYDSQRLACVSCNPSGAPATGSAFTAERTNNGVAATAAAEDHPLSDDGRQVFFSTPDALVPQDVNGRIDVYEYDVPSGTVHLLTSGRDPSDSYFMGSSASGEDAFFITRARLTGGDIDNGYDLYDARVGGGFPEPASPPPVCSGEACRGSAAVAPGASSPGSSTLNGQGNLAAAPLAGKVVSRRSATVSRLSRALKACKRKAGSRRHRCEASARRRFGAKRSVKASGRGK